MSIAACVAGPLKRALILTLKRNKIEKSTLAFSERAPRYTARRGDDTTATRRDTAR